MSDNGLTTSEQARVFAIGKLGNEVSHQLENWLSPWGNANVDLLVDKEGNFTGSKGAGLSRCRITATTLPGISTRSPSGYGSGRVSASAGGWAWLLGYNSFYDKALDDRMARGSVGAEAWASRCACRRTTTSRSAAGSRGSLTQQQRMASGYDDRPGAAAVLSAH
jgi:hypothetical protein